MPPRPHDDLDLGLRPEPGGGPPAHPDEQHAAHRRALILSAVAGVVVLAILGWFWWSRDVAPEEAYPELGVTEAPVDAAPAEPLGTGDAAVLPPLGELDPTVRTLMSSLSAQPELASLLATEGLVRNFVVGVDRVGRGLSPVGQVSVLRPDQPFSVERPNQRTRIQSGAFERYAGAVAMFQSLEPEALARVYGQLRPRLNEAYAELGVPGQTFDQAVERAIVHLLEVDPQGAAGEVAPVKGTTYAWVDERTERLSAAQKQLLRLGPAQASEVQAHLRRVAAALGIPAERLPAR